MLSQHPGHTKQILHSKRVTFSPTQRNQVAARQSWDCNLCKQRLHWAFEIDHITPLSEGGSNEPSNLQALCVQCHAVKSREEKPNATAFTAQQLALLPPQQSLQNALQLPEINQYEQYLQSYHKHAAMAFMDQFKCTRNQ